MPALPRDGDPGQEQDGYPGTGENPPVEVRFVSEIPESSLQDDHRDRFLVHAGVVEGVG